MTCSHVFSRAWRELHAFASSSDWFMALFASVVISLGFVLPYSTENRSWSKFDLWFVIHEYNFVFQMTKKVAKMKMFFPGMLSNAILNRSWTQRRKSIKLARERERLNNKHSWQSVHRIKLGFVFTVYWAILKFGSFHYIVCYLLYVIRNKVK